jgi:2-hydroxy-3-oxopropionate reductase
MGTPMARNLLTKGFAVSGYDVVADLTAGLARHGARAATSPADAARDADVVITMLPADAHVEAAMLGPDGAGPAMRSGSIWLQMSTIKPVTVQRVAAKLAERGIRALDCPVSRGARVAQGELSVFAGGDTTTLDEVRDVLGAMATEILHCGPLGMGQAAKLVNNMLSMTKVAVAAEGLIFGLKLGLDPKTLYDVINAGSGASVAWRDRAKQMLRREFEPEVRFYTDLAYKDVSLAIDSAQEVGAPMIFSSIARELYNALRTQGGGTLHYPAIVTLFERLANIEARGDV